LLLSRKRQPCQILDLGAIEALSYYGHDFLKAMGKPQELLQLTLASIKCDPSHYPILTLDATLLQKCAALQVLSLDYDTLSDELLHTIQVLPLRKLLIAVHGLDSEEHPVASAYLKCLDIILLFNRCLSSENKIRFALLLLPKRLAYWPHRAAFTLIWHFRTVQHTRLHLQLFIV